MNGVEGRLVVHVDGEVGRRGKSVNGSIDRRKFGGIVVRGRYGPGLGDRVEFIERRGDSSPGREDDIGGTRRLGGVRVCGAICAYVERV